MTVYVIIGENSLAKNISARAVFVNRAKAEQWIKDDVFNDRAVIVELELDPENS